MTRSVAIVGGGIAGLALAAALDPTRFDVTLHEAQPERAQYGGPLGVWPAAQRALRRIGVDHPVVDDGSPPTGGGLKTLSGTTLVSASVNLRMVDRPALMAAMDAAVPSSVTRVAGSVTDAASLAADLVVGADGVRSVVRGLVWPRAAERAATPWLTLRGVSASPPRAGEAGEYWGPGHMFGIVGISGGRTYWFSCHRSKLPEPIRTDEATAEARVAFEDAAPNVRRLLDEAGRGTSATRVWLTPPMPRYVNGRYVVIGDAAHAMAPNLGRGACEAIVDAVTLGQVLNRGGSLASWQARRLPATQVARAASSAMLRLATTQRLRAPRDAALGGMGRIALRR